MLVGGIVAYKKLGRLEDPEFTIKEALIVTPHPGASAEEVALEVTNPIESACQQLAQLKRVESESTRGRSVVSAIIQDRYDKDKIPQVWDELRGAVCRNGEMERRTAAWARHAMGAFWSPARLQGPPNNRCKASEGGSISPLGATPMANILTTRARSPRVFILFPQKQRAHFGASTRLTLKALRGLSSGSRKRAQKSVAPPPLMMAARRMFGPLLRVRRLETPSSMTVCRSP